MCAPSPRISWSQMSKSPWRSGVVNAMHCRDTSIFIATLYGLIAEKCWLPWNARSMKFSHLWTVAEPWSLHRAIKLSTCQHHALCVPSGVSFTSLAFALLWNMVVTEKESGDHREQPRESCQHLEQLHPQLSDLEQVLNFSELQLLYI